jgi:hypothetical protein
MASSLLDAAAAAAIFPCVGALVARTALTT